MRKMSGEEVSYLAGLMDGEAYVGITRSTANKTAKSCRRGIAYRVMVSVRMTDPRPLRYAKSISGVGKILEQKKPENPKWKQSWSWNVWSREAAWLLSLVQPHMKVKGKAARTCIRFQGLMRYPGRNGLADAEWSVREKLWRETKVRA